MIDPDAMTLVEFLVPLTKASFKAKVLGVLYYLKTYEKKDGVTVEALRATMVGARVPRAAKANLADVLARAGHHVQSPQVSAGRKVWALTESGDRHVRALLGDEQVPLGDDSLALMGLLSTVSDNDVRDYLEESIKCLDAMALRAAVVFLWTGVVRTLQLEMLTLGGRTVSTAILKHDPKSRAVSRVDDFAYIKDRVSLEAAQTLGLLDKGEKGALMEALDLRNRCGHPTNYRPGVKRVSSFIEDVVGIVLSRK